ncbi:hypothetical protein GCM10009839_82200 [Catenulispora yoronensis]|uniref:Protein-glutamine gamma-glutamyltransferase-like C-terminal domain-containing protein n=1 Tax=Catenulispora yoronensis TaxID=450799 RepID=A0ABN2VCR0_9ACTN
MTGNTRRWLPTAIVVVAVAGLGVASRRVGGLDSGPAAGAGKDLRPLVALGAAVALAAVAISFAKHRDNGFGPLHRAGTATALLLATTAVMTPVGLFFFGRVAGPPAAPTIADLTPATSTPSMSRKAGLDQHHVPPHKDSRWQDLIAQAVVLLIVAAVLALVGYFLFQLLRRLRMPQGPLLVMEFDELDEAALEQLAEAVAAGSRALAYQGDAREAVIACYAAMEDALSAEGNGRREADTPEDFLARITGRHLIPDGPARLLTDLFREARFSRHPIDEGKREQARTALTAIADHLRVRAAEAQEAAAARAAAEGKAAEGNAATSTAAASAPGGRG